MTTDHVWGCSWGHLWLILSKFLDNVGMMLFFIWYSHKKKIEINQFTKNSSFKVSENQNCWKLITYPVNVGANHVNSRKLFRLLLTCSFYGHICSHSRGSQMVWGLYEQSPRERPSLADPKSFYYTPHRSRVLVFREPFWRVLPCWTFCWIGDRTYYRQRVFLRCK